MNIQQFDFLQEGFFYKLGKKYIVDAGSELDLTGIKHKGILITPNGLDANQSVFQISFYQSDKSLSPYFRFMIPNPIDVGLKNPYIWHGMIAKIRSDTSLSTWLPNPFTVVLLY